MSESDEQQMVVSWFRLQYPKYRLIAVPNGQWVAGEGKRKFALINKYKKEGMFSGVSDLFLCAKTAVHGGLWLEMKNTGKTYSSVSKDQRLWLKNMEDAGYLAVWCPGFDRAKKEIIEYMKWVMKNETPNDS